MVETFSTKFWIKISLLNLLIVAAIGVLMRYKIGFEFDYLDQKHLQYAHSHFAFCGWVTQTLFVLIVLFLKSNLNGLRIKRYNILLLTNLGCAYFMLLSFSVEGYGLFSIFFSTLSVFVSYVFAYWCYNDLNKLKSHHSSVLWLKASLVFSVLSSIGTFALAYMMATKNLPQHFYLASVYWFLHFQYNGWFFFACVGLFIAYLKSHFPLFKPSNSIFWLFSLSCIPAYGLSTLWLELPIWIYIIIVMGAFAQVFGWIILLSSLKKISFLKYIHFSTLSRFLFVALAIALSIKLGLQLISTIPAVSKLAFGFRPIVIAYLHLILLAIISVFLITYIYTNHLISINNYTEGGLIIFGLGVFINEITLAIQGIASLSYNVVPYINTVLFINSVVLFSGLILLFTANRAISYQGKAV